MPYPDDCLRPKVETLYTAHWTVEFDSGTENYQRIGVVKADFDQTMITLYFDRFSPCFSQTFPIYGKLIKFWLELEK
jgi:hypothetical protein